MTSLEQTDENAIHIDRFGSHGVWGGYNAFPDDLARGIENAGYGAIWLGGSPKDLTSVRGVLAATESITVATGIVNIWNTDPATIAGEFGSLESEFPGRFYLGIGAGHPEATAEYQRPYEAVSQYLDVLDAEGVPVRRRVLAALGPKMLRLSARRALGAHPYLTTPGHDRIAREILGPSALLAPEQKVVLGTDPVAARAIGRPKVENPYLHLTNYVANLKRLGFTDADIANGGSDELIDALVDHGTTSAVRAAVDEHLTEGANHVAIQLLGSADPIADLTAIIRAR